MDNIPLWSFFYTLHCYKMLLNGDEDQFEPKKSFVYKSLRKIMPISNHIDGEHFFIKRKHITAATPLLLP
jgi:tellurite resistance protein TerC